MIRARNEARIQANADEQSALLNAKTNTERVKICQRIEDRNHSENQRIEMAEVVQAQCCAGRNSTGVIKATYVFRDRGCVKECGGGPGSKNR